MWPVLKKLPKDIEDSETLNYGDDGGNFIKSRMSGAMAERLPYFNFPHKERATSHRM